MNETTAVIAHQINRPHFITQREQADVKQWRFLRFCGGRLMAEGAKVHAATAEEARAKAAQLFSGDDYSPHDVFVLRTEEAMATWTKAAFPESADSSGVPK